MLFEVFRAAKRIERYYRTNLISFKDERTHTEKRQGMVQELEKRSQRLNDIDEEQIDSLANQITGQVNLHYVAAQTIIYKIMNWLGVQVQQFYFPSSYSPSDMAKFIISRLSLLRDELNYDDHDEFLQIQEEGTPSSLASNKDVQKLKSNENQEELRPPLQCQTISIEQLGRIQQNSSVPSFFWNISNKQYRVLQQIQQKLKQPYYRFIKQFIKTCQNYVYYPIQMFGIYINYLLQSGSYDYIRKFIIRDHQKSSVSIGNQIYIIDQEFIDNLQSIQTDIICDDVWLTIIRHYLATIPFKKTQSTNLLLQLSTQIHRKSIYVRELFSSYQNIEHLIEHLLPMVERNKQRHTSSKFCMIVRHNYFTICCHRIIQHMYQITSYDDYESRWIQANELIELLNQQSQAAKIEVIYLGPMVGQQKMLQKIMAELYLSSKKRDKLFSYQIQKLTDRKVTKIEIPQDRNKRQVRDITFQQFWRKAIQMNLTQIQNLVQLHQRGIMYSEEVVCVLVSIYNYLLKCRPDIIGECLRVDKEKATLTFYPKNGKENGKNQQYFEYFFNKHGYQIILKHGTQSKSIKMAFKQMYQKMVLFLLQEQLAIHSKGYKVSQVLKLLVAKQYQHTRIYFSLNQQFIHNNITYKQIIPKIVQCFNRQGETIRSKFVLKHFDSHCCRLTSQNTQIRPQNINKEQSKLQSCQLSKYTQKLSISLIQIKNNIQQATIEQSQILKRIYLFAEQIGKQSGVQIEIHDSYEENFYKIQITPRNIK